MAEMERAIAVLVTADPAARRVLRVTAAVDVGVPVHPSGVIAQVEGGVMDAVSTVLRAQITVRDGAVVQSSFRDYAWARIGDCPDIDVLLVPSEAPIGGLGELAYPGAAGELPALWRAVEAAARELLGSVTIAELAAAAGGGSRREGVLDPVPSP